MTRPPFGFGPGEPTEGGDPLGLSALFSGLLGNDPIAALQRLLTSDGGPVNWDLAQQVADAALKDDDPAVEPADRRAVEEAGRLADLWLDGVTALPAAAGAAAALGRREWLTATLAAWRRLVDPVAERVVAAMAGALEETLRNAFGGGTGELPEQVRAQLPPGMDPAQLLAGATGGPGLTGVMRQLGGLLFGTQVGQALGGLAKEVVGAAEVGLPLTAAPQVALLPANVASFAAGLEVPIADVRLYLALREAATERLFAHVPWLAAHLFDAVDAYARGIEVDVAAIEEAVGGLDPTDPAAMQEALSGGLIQLPPTPAQQVALGRLEVALALVEGWVDAVVDAAAAPRLPAAGALREMVRRRRATGGPAEQTFGTLVGLQLRPRRLREAAQLWAAVTAERGATGRDQLWSHPDLLPGAAELDDPAAFLDRAGSEPGVGTDWDAELRNLGPDATE